LDRSQKFFSSAYIKEGEYVLDQRIKEHIEAADWPEITRKLAAYARYFFKIRDNQAVLPMGSSVESAVHEAIRKLLDGTRRWNPENVDLLGFLKGVVKSEISHLLSLKEASLTTSVDPENIEKYQSESPNPEQAVIAKENSRLVKIVHQKLIEQAESDSDYLSVALCLESGIHKPKDIAQEMDLDVGEVYKIRKRWERDFEKILREVLAKAN
jgi:hypothetical protein